MKKSKLQVMIEFLSHLSQLKKVKKSSTKLPLSKNGSQLSMVIALLLFFSTNTFAVTYYSRTSGGNWNVATTWSTVGYGNATNTGTFPSAGDVANIGDGYTVLINAAVSVGTINIGQGVSGILEFRSTSNYTVNVSGSVTVNTGARFQYNTAVVRTHQLNISKNFTNFGVVDFYVGAGQIVNLTFNTNSNSTVSGTGTWDLNNVTLNKTTSTAFNLNVQTSAFESGIRAFIGTYGTYIHNNTGTYNINPTAATFTIGPNMIYQIPLGTMWFASAADNVVLQGQLFLTGGNVKIGTTAGIQGLRYDQNGANIPRLDISSGNLEVYGGITYGTASSTEPFHFRMTGGTVTINSGSTGSNRQLLYLNDVATSTFFMSAGTVTFQKPNTNGALTVDFSIPGTNGTVTSNGGILQFGNNSTASGAVFNFRPYTNATQPHFRVAGSAGNAVTLATSYGSTANFRLLSLYIDVNKTFDIRSIGGAVGDTKTMTLLATCNGVEALYNAGTFQQRLSTVTFNTTGAQAIGGPNITTFYNLSINNANHITLNKAANVSNLLSMVNGKLFTTNTNVLTCLAAASSNIGSSTSYVDGPMVHTVASAVLSARTYPIGKGSAYRPVVLTVTHNNAVSVTYRAEVTNSPATALPFTYPPTISNVSAVRYTRFVRSAVSNFTSGRIQMYYNTDDVVGDKNTLIVAHDDGVSQWQNFGGVATANWVGNITSGLFTNFHNYFALANPPGGGNALPVSLTSFTAALSGKDVEVKWTTESEINNDYFTLERSSDSYHYSELAIVDGAGNSTSTNNYTFNDQQALRGISYYRLKQTDFDGNFEYFPVAVVQNKTKGTFVLFPNPASNSIVHLSGESNLENAVITVQDVTGRTIPSTYRATENGSIEIQLDEYYLKTGAIYFINATDGQTVVREKLLIN